ncbi:Atp18 F1F0 ATP synthase complex subunit [Candida orthopsilosis Co 90-125]|uniref:Atp18 F1F0 ATP synthase complex subunit n=1 Tax=Candida orthopsilosis (strain 90-125) TaxID=1136231 RepID=H8WZ01_CANO9|nr:Atp18 F1F0 ATP synthase complex subunit [Candida orthopsilosis Co 90-125]CCG21633.1 Atp18 F1F0 ATP synthase complex subunit [Candida orthopsilosis Co 90-125]
MPSLPKYPFPVLKTYWPYAVGAGVTYYLIYKASIASANSDEFINDPRNPRFKNGGKFIDLNKKEEAH